MNGSELFDVWAPAESVWSRWAKPVLFADRDRGPAAPAPPGELALPELRLSLDPQTAVVVDLPGARSVLAGLALARQGCRPVPLFNGAHHGGAALVDTAAIVSSLEAGAGELARLALSPEAPPAFLLDAQRLAPGATARPGTFDNRWIAFPQDFPSAGFLRSRQIRRVLVVSTGTAGTAGTAGGASEPAVDLAHVLLRWQEGGLELLATDPDAALGGLRPLRVQPPSGFRQLWYRALAAMGLRRNSAGGFGSVIPTPSSSGSGFS